jgi:endonuclease/exonuclease/phosphatase family metal-dependent hydrolase
MGTARWPVGHTLAIEAHVLGSGEPGSLDALICVKYGKESMNIPKSMGSALIGVLLQFIGAVAMMSSPRSRTGHLNLLAPKAGMIAISMAVPELIPHGKLHVSAADTFSVLSWNCLLPNSEDNWWCEKMYQSHVPADARQWPHRQQLIKDRVLLADADIVCIQEAAGGTFESDFAFMRAQGYEAVLHQKFRFRCATFYRPTVFALQSQAHEDRALVTSFRWLGSAQRTLYLANVHLSGGAAPDRRLRQIHGATECIRKWLANNKPKPQGRRGSAVRREQEEGREDEARRAAGPARAGHGEEPSSPEPPCVLIAGDFNSDGNTAVRTLLVDGSVEPTWREPQYADMQLTSRRRSHTLGPLADAGEVAYGQNVCDGDWGDWGGRTCYARYRARRPATYVVPSLASVFLQRSPTSTNRQQLVADNEVLARLTQHRESPPPLSPPRELSAEDRALCETTPGADLAFVTACRRAFDAIDADRGGSISAAELREALERLSVRNLAGEEPSAVDVEAMLSAADTDENGTVDFAEFVAIILATRGGGDTGSGWWARFLGALRGGEGGGSSSAEQELVRLETEADVENLIARFTPTLRAALDTLFDRLAAASPGTPAAGATSSSNSISEDIERVIPEKAALAWLELVNRELGRGGTYRSVMAAFEQSPTGRRELTRRAWYGVFARELGEGKWWQVAYDLDVSGVAVSSMELSVGGGTFGGAAQSRVVDEGRGEQGARRPLVRTPRQAPRRHYEAWLDYVYYSSKGLRLVGYQESLSEEQAQLIYRDGDALPNAWHPSDHLPVGCVFQWADSNGSGPTV